MSITRMDGSAELLDLREKTITTFLLYETLQELKKNRTVELVTPMYDFVDTDLNSWSELTGNKILQKKEGDTYSQYLIEKGSNANFKKKKLVLILSSANFLELLTPLGFALCARLVGHDVSFYFNGDAVKVLSKKYKPALPGLASLFSSFAVNGLNEVGHIPPQEKIKQLEKLGAKIYICGPSMQHFKVKREELYVTKYTVCEYVTFLKEMTESDMLIYK